MPTVAEISGRVYRSRDTLWRQARIVRTPGTEVAAVLDPVPATTSDRAAAFEPLRKQVLSALGTMFDPRLTARGERAMRPPAFDAYRAFAAGLEDHAASRFAAALSGFARAAALDSAYAQPRLWAAWMNIQIRRWSAADSIVTSLESIAATLSPLDRAWLEHGHGDAAERALRRAIAWHARPEIHSQPETAERLAQLFYEVRDDERADSVARALLPDTVHPATPCGVLGLLAARRGDRVEAERWSAKLAQLERPYEFGEHTLWRAQIAAAIGDSERAVELLRQAAAEGLDRHGWHLVHIAGEFDDLRRDTAFVRVVRPR